MLVFASITPDTYYCYNTASKKLILHRPDEVVDYKNLHDAYGALLDERTWLAEARDGVSSLARKVLEDM